jgi:hypothetical protein
MRAGLLGLDPHFPSPFFFSFFFSARLHLEPLFPWLIGRKTFR